MRIRVVLAVAVLLLGGPAARASEVMHLDGAHFVLDAAESPPADADPRWQPVALPDRWPRSTTARTTRSWRRSRSRDWRRALFEIALAPGAILQRDIVVDPFFEDVPVAPAAGTLLARISIVPEPSIGALLGLGLALLGLRPRRRRSP